MEVFSEWHYSNSEIDTVDIGDECEETDCQVY